MGVETAKKIGIWVVRASGVRPDELTTYAARPTVSGKRQGRGVPP
jgi:hypothetical protein